MSALHITNGDSAAGTLRTFLTHPVVITADPLWAGPAPKVDDDTWYALRGRHLSDGTDAAADAVRKNLAEWDAALDAAVCRGEEVVLWFEHDLFDQLLLIRVLDRIAATRRDQRAARGPISLICIDRFPGVERFIGLGQLDAQQLATLLPTRRPVTPEQLDVAHRAWNAFRLTDPTTLAQLAATPESTAALPFLHDALRRFLEEFPSTANGLSRTAQAVLEVMGDRSGAVFGVFRATQMREAAPFIGDLGVYDIIRALAAARTPLLRIETAPPSVQFHARTVALTDAGRSVRDRQADAVRLNGIDEWRGGVHLAGQDRSPWRWDAARETLVSWDH